MPWPGSFRIAAGLISALLALSASAQNAASEAAARSQSESEPGASREEVVVRGRRLSEIELDLRVHVREFVGEIATSPAGRGYARWHRRVCVGVHNLERSAAQYLVDRISRLALDVGLEPGEPGCRPGVIVIFSTDGRALAAQLVESEPLLFRPGVGRCCMNLSLAALDDFVESDRAVRWWHVSLPVDARTGQPAIRLQQAEGPPVISVAGPSRIHSGIRDDMRRVIIIVDATKLTGTTWQQLGDYLAVVSLVQIDPDANPADFDSILNLFRNPEAYSGLTDWDRSYVRALYGFDRERRPDIQVNEIVSRIVNRELGSGEP